MMLLAEIDWHSFLFFFFALIACGFAVAVVATSNIVRMAFYLTVALGATAGLFFLAGAEFVGAMQLLIYVGGTLVLLIFGVMLTAQERFVDMKTGAGDWVIAFVVGGGLLATLLYATFSVADWRAPNPDRDAIGLAASKTAAPLGLGLIGVFEGGPGYLLPFEIVSVHLLVVLIGAAYLARTKRRGPPVAAQRAAPQAAPGERRRPLSVSLLAAGGIVVSLLLAIACFAARPQIYEFLVDRDIVPPPWLASTIGLLFLVSALMYAIFFAWQKWALVVAAVVPVAQLVLLYRAEIPWWILGVFALVCLAPVIVLIAATCRGGERSVWSQMD